MPLSPDDKLISDMVLAAVAVAMKPYGDKIEETNANVKLVKAAIDGNGQGVESGLKWRVAQIEQWQQRHDEREAEQTKDLKGLITPLLTQGLMYLVGGLLFVVVGHALGLLH